MKQNILKEKSFAFAVRMVNFYRYLKKQHGEYIISQQLIRSGTSVGALIREATEFLTKKMFDSLNRDCEELLKLLIATVKTSKLKLK